MIAKIIIWSLVFGVLANTIPRWLPGYQIFGLKVYYVGQALSFVLIILAGKLNDGKSDWAGIIFDATMLLAIMNLMDELFFNPLNFGMVEKVTASAIIIWTVFRLIKKWRTDTMTKP